MTPLLEVEGVQAGYGSLPVLFGVDLAIQPGEAVNVGIRRARGSFVTPKASDTFFSPPTIAMIARRDPS